MKPTVGRSVHFTSISGHCQHAVILDVLAVEPGSVVLEVHPAYDDLYRVPAMCSGTHQEPGWWHWPERAEEEPPKDNRITVCADCGNPTIQMMVGRSLKLLHRDPVHDSSHAVTRTKTVEE